MPAYDFRCTSCDHVFEIVRPAGRSSEEVCCPSCDAEAKRVFTPVGVHFKGSGFHNTDYRKKPAEESSTPAAPCGGTESCASCPAAGKAAD